MTQDCTQDPLVTPSTLDGMMARWTSEAPAGRGHPAADTTRAAKDILCQAVGRHAEFLAPADRALYGSLMTARDAAELRALFFELFDLLVRTRGPALAVLRIRELHGLLRVDQAAPAAGSTSAAA